MVYPETFSGFAVTDCDKWSEATKIEFTPKKLGDYDVDIKISACGVCGSDVHTVKAGWSKPDLPVIPGHEIVGKVVAVGPKVDDFQIGQRVGCGAQIWSCGTCIDCKSDNETYCPQMVDTYNDHYPDGDKTWGGYSSHVRAHRHWVFPLPENLSDSDVAPMLCAGITTYSPLVRNGAGPGKSVGVIGIGGLGHFAIMWAKALGATVYTFSRTSDKKQVATELGSDYFIPTWEEKDFATKYARKLDVIIQCGNSSEGFDVGSYMRTLKVHGKLVTVGLPEDNLQVSVGDIFGNGALFGASHLGSRKEMLDMLDLASKKGIKCWYEDIPISEEGVKKALVGCHENKPRFRYVLTDYQKIFGQE
ncbi:unnamed protein product [Kuraishia capsulata CBS 1993]|uniref:alcohol dehydrogenase (NADP(+)) n=1 Tax=Kuraishia capsulata CBS 1993 TaxID=1382522 RepID=W6MJU7_9ASCO|nr:uncharacterized protein KUCA_T00000774001 [Kuraishia capsulata CBS 1993]CDK24807.1 unnamed protein product [Kuraishia capsulata CBS 1993]